MREEAVRGSVQHSARYPRRGAGMTEICYAGIAEPILREGGGGWEVGMGFGAGADTDAVLAEHGYSAAEIAALRAAGAIGAPPADG